MTPGNRILALLRAHGTGASITIIVILYVVMFAPTLPFPFLWDDRMLIVHNVHITSLDNLPMAFNGHYLKMINEAGRLTPYYRPISLSVLFVEYHLFGGESATGYHLVHFFFHLMSGILLFFITRHLIDHSTIQTDQKIRNLAGIITSLMFLLLPYTVDAVLFLTDLGDLMALCFSLLSLILLERHFRSGALLPAVGLFVCAAIAFGSKETGLSLIPLGILWWLLRRPHVPVIRTIAPAAGLLSAAGLYLTARTLALTDVPPFSLKQALLRYPADFATAVRWGIFPHPLSLKEDLVTGFSGGWWLGVLLIIATIAAVLLLRKRTRMATALIVAFCATISPSLLGLQYASTFDPRYLYIPGAFLAVGAGLAFVHLSSLLRWTLVPLFASLLLLSLIRIHAWSDNFAFWQLEYERHPDRVISAVNFGAANEEHRRFDDAANYYRKAASLAEQEGTANYAGYANYRIGYLLHTVFGAPDEAMPYYQKAVRFDPTMKTWVAIGNIHAADNHFEKALAAYQQAQKLDPGSYVVHISLANALTGLKRFDEALSHMEQARRMLSPDDKRMKAFERRRQMILDYRRRVEGAGKP